MTNNKRKWKAIGASLCAMALAISTGSMAVSAASPSGNDEIAMTQSVQSKECQVRQNETTGKVEMSLDNGKTWEEAKETDIQFASEVSTAQARQAEDGKDRTQRRRRQNLEGRRGISGSHSDGNSPKSGNRQI